MTRTNPINTTNTSSSNFLPQKSFWNHKIVSNITNSVKAIYPMLEKVNDMIKTAQLIMGAATVILCVIYLVESAWNAKTPTSPDIGSEDWFRRCYAKVRQNDNQRREAANAVSSKSVNPSPEIKNYLDQREKRIAELAQKTDEKEKYQLAEEIYLADMNKDLFEKATEIVNSEYFNPKNRDDALFIVESVKGHRAEGKITEEAKESGKSSYVKTETRVTSTQYETALNTFSQIANVDRENLKNLSPKEFKKIFIKTAEKVHSDKGTDGTEFQNLSDAYDKIKAYKGWA